MILNVAKAMYCQFEKKTILIEMKIKDIRDNNPVIKIKNDDWVLIDLVPFLFFFSALSISFIYLNHSLTQSISYQLPPEMKGKDTLQVMYLYSNHLSFLLRK